MCLGVLFLSVYHVHARTLGGQKRVSFPGAHFFSTQTIPLSQLICQVTQQGRPGCCMIWTSNKCCPSSLQISVCV